LTANAAARAGAFHAKHDIQVITRQMPLADAIRKHGFTRWYERQLYESFAYLVTGFLALIMMAIALEVSHFRESVAGFLMLVAVATGGGGLCVVAWIRFNRLLARAEYFAGQAHCPACKVYARFAVVSTRFAPDTMDECALGVRCRKCAHEWTIA
jgi:predicted Zn finger-like uncharacterized protein